MSEAAAKIDDSDAQLAEVRAKRAALAEARRIREEQRAQAEQLVDEVRGLADDEAIEAAENEHGAKKIAVVKTDMGAIILKRAHPNIFKRFQDKGSMKHEDLERLVRPCLVYPDVAKFDAIMAELPATMLRCADTVSVLAGIRQEDVSAK
jgi:hypothetical protein